MPRVCVIGLGMGPKDFSPRVLEAVNRAQVLAGGTRMLGWFPEHKGERLPLEVGLDAWLEALASISESKAVAVLASGDAAFYGIAERIIKRLGSEMVEVVPNITTVQAAMAKLCLPWQDAEMVSLHGRKTSPLFAALTCNKLVVVYTDPVNSPDAIAREMLARGQTGWDCHVLEDIGSASERISSPGLEEMARYDFSALNILVLRKKDRTPSPRLGLSEDDFIHHKGLITKSEVRAVALAKLRLLPGHTLWDLGAGSGSVGLEACALLWRGRVIAVEKNPDRIEQIKVNRSRLGAANLKVVHAELPAGLADLPAPDRVFIGGGGNGLAAIMEASLARLKAGGILVVSAVRLEALGAARSVFENHGLYHETIQIQVNNGAPLAGGTYFRAQNPVFLTSAAKD